MTMNGNQRNFNGAVMRITGNDISLNSLIDELDFVAGVEVLSRIDITSCAGELALQSSVYARGMVSEMARKHGLSVMG